MNLQLHTRPDEQLRNLILEALVESIPAIADFRIGVLNGIVHLAGTASSLTERAGIEERVCSMPGVRAVVNRIAAPGAPPPGRTIQLDLKEDNHNLQELSPEASAGDL